MSIVIDVNKEADLKAYFDTAKEASVKGRLSGWAKKVRTAASEGSEKAHEGAKKVREAAHKGAVKGKEYAHKASEKAKEVAQTAKEKTYQVSSAIAKKTAPPDTTTRVQKIKALMGQEASARKDQAVSAVKANPGKTTAVVGAAGAAAGYAAGHKKED